MVFSQYLMFHVLYSLYIIGRNTNDTQTSTNLLVIMRKFTYACYNIYTVLRNCIQRGREAVFVGVAKLVHFGQMGRAVRRMKCGMGGMGWKATHYREQKVWRREASGRGMSWSARGVSSEGSSGGGDWGFGWR